MIAIAILIDIFSFPFLWKPLSIYALYILTISFHGKVIGIRIKVRNTFSRIGCLSVDTSHTHNHNQRENAEETKIKLRVYTQSIKTRWSREARLGSSIHYRFT
jgi:hypothetical protein